MANEPVKLIECPRDAWQGLPRQIPTRLKGEYLRALIKAGFRHIDAVSFVSPKTVPQMADSEEVILSTCMPGIDTVEIIGIVVNKKGVERAMAAGEVRTLGYPFSISETFLRRNQNQSREKNMAILQTIKQLADDAGLAIVAYISMAFGNPYGDPWSEKEIEIGITQIINAGVRSISLADTVGLANAALIRRVVTTAIKSSSGCEIGLHLHSRQADAEEKILAAYDAGCRRFDSAIGGLGGCPFAQDALVGNIPTESVIAALQQRGIEVPLKIDNVLQLNAKIARDFA